MKRILDWLTVLFLGFALIAAVQLHYAQTKQSYVIWLALLILDLPFVTAVLVYLGRRGFNTFPPVTERTKRILDWLTLIPLGFWPGTIIWSSYTHNEHTPVILTVFMVMNLPLFIASVIWLVLRMDKIPMIRWFTYNIVMRGVGHIIIAAILLLLLVKWLWKVVNGVT